MCHVCIVLTRDSCSWSESICNEIRIKVSVTFLGWNFETSSCVQLTRERALTWTAGERSFHHATRN